MFWQLITVYNPVKTFPELYKWHFIIFELTDLVLCFTLINLLVRFSLADLISNVHPRKRLF